LNHLRKSAARQTITVNPQMMSVLYVKKSRCSQSDSEPQDICKAPLAEVDQEGQLIPSQNRPKVYSG